MDKTRQTATCYHFNALAHDADTLEHAADGAGMHGVSAQSVGWSDLGEVEYEVKSRWPSTKAAFQRVSSSLAALTSVWCITPNQWRRLDIAG